MDNKKSDRRVLVIGLDGATFDVLGPWLDDGTMPVVAEMRQRGSFGRLASTIPPLTPPAWSSFATGMNPGKHGVLQFVTASPPDTARGHARYVPVNSTCIRAETLWRILSRQGYRVGVVNVPLTYPPQAVNGVMITGMLTPPGATDFAYPPDLARQLGDYRIDLDYFRGEQMTDHQALPELDRLLRELRRLLEARAKAVRDLLVREEWDLFVAVFTGTDRLGHFLWPYHQSMHTPDDRPEIRSLRTAVQDYYRRLDSIIGDLVTSAGDPTVIMMSDHGMGPAQDKVVHVNEWLRKEGLLNLLPMQTSWANPNWWFSKLGVSRAKLARLKDLSSHLKPIKALAARATKIPLPIDHSRTQAYFRTLYASVGGVYVETHCRENPTAYEALCDKIIEGLEQILDPETGEQVTEFVSRSTDIYKGDALENPPDLVVVLKPRYYCGHRLGSSAIVTPRVETKYDSRMVGDHRPDGIFIASGDGVASGGEVHGLRLEDLAPTVLYLLDAGIPPGMDGRVSEQVVDSRLISERAPRFEASHGDTHGGSQHAELSAKQEQDILDRLRGLGYIE